MKLYIVDLPVIYPVETEIIGRTKNFVTLSRSQFIQYNRYKFMCFKATSSVPQDSYLCLPF